MGNFLLFDYSNSCTFYIDEIKIGKVFCLFFTHLQWLKRGVQNFCWEEGVQK